MKKYNRIFSFYNKDKKISYTRLFLRLSLNEARSRPKIVWTPRPLDSFINLLRTNSNILTGQKYEHMKLPRKSVSFIAKQNNIPSQVKIFTGINIHNIFMFFDKNNLILTIMKTFSSCRSHKSI